MSPLSLGMPALRRDINVAPSTEGRPNSSELIDRFGRVARDLRISITEKCSLRCTYCMPAEGLPEIARENLLTAEEISRLVRIAVNDLGVKEVRFTGGEPLMRADLEEIIRSCTLAAPGVKLAMTTNGIGLDKRIDGLLAAGLGRVNISLDTVDRKHFAALTRRDKLPAVFAGIKAAQEAGLTPLKLNAVLMRETLPGAADLLEWSIKNECHLRFIEEMPLDADEQWRRDNMVSAQELLEVLEESFSLTPVGREDPSSPAEEWTVNSSAQTVGIIASVTRPFCDACDRTRLTAEGTIRSCLFGDEETDIRDYMRAGANDSELADRWRAAMWGKQAGHGMDEDTFARPLRSMGGIGG